MRSPPCSYNPCISQWPVCHGIFFLSASYGYIRFGKPLSAHFRHFPVLAPTSDKSHQTPPHVPKPPSPHIWDTTRRKLPSTSAALAPFPPSAETERGCHRSDFPRQRAPAPEMSLRARNAASAGIAPLFVRKPLRCRWEGGHGGDGSCRIWSQKRLGLASFQLYSGGDGDWRMMPVVRWASRSGGGGMS